MITVPNFTYSREPVLHLPANVDSGHGAGGLVITGRWVPSRLDCRCGNLIDVPIEPGTYDIQCPRCGAGDTVAVESVTLHV